MNEGLRFQNEKNVDRGGEKNSLPISGRICIPAKINYSNISKHQFVSEWSGQRMTLKHLSSPIVALGNSGGNPTVRRIQTLHSDHTDCQ